MLDGRVIVRQVQNRMVCRNDKSILGETEAKDSLFGGRNRSANPHPDFNFRQRLVSSWPRLERRRAAWSCLLAAREEEGTASARLMHHHFWT